jgi:hypothetical protein
MPFMKIAVLLKLVTNKLTETLITMLFVCSEMVKVGLEAGKEGLDNMSAIRI